MTAAMALPPKFKGHRLLFFSDDASAPAPTESAATEPLHTIELYLDYVCPFSAKLFKTFVTSVAPSKLRQPTYHRILAQKEGRKS